MLLLPSSALTMAIAPSMPMLQRLKLERDGGKLAWMRESIWVEQSERTRTPTGERRGFKRAACLWNRHQCGEPRETREKEPYFRDVIVRLCSSFAAMAIAPASPMLFSPRLLATA